MYSVWSTLYLGQDVEDYNCYVDEKSWKRITNEITTNRMFARIIKGDKFWICALGSPVLVEIDSANSIFIPQWMLEQIDCNGDGEELEVEWLPAEVFDESTRIVLKSHDTEFHCEGIQDILSYELTKLAVLKKDTTIKVNIQGVNVEFIVHNLEPASVVLCQGDEVTLDFEQPYRVPTPYPFEEMPEFLSSIDESLVVPSAPEVVPSAPEVVVPAKERFNPWRNKDFKPNVS